MKTIIDLLVCQLSMMFTNRYRTVHTRDIGAHYARHQHPRHFKEYSKCLVLVPPVDPEQSVIYTCMNSDS